MQPHMYYRLYTIINIQYTINNGKRIQFNFLAHGPKCILTHAIQQHLDTAIIIFFLITFNNAHAQLTVLNTSLAVSKQKQATAEHCGVEKQKTSTSAFSYITLFLYFTNGFEYSSCLCLLCPLGRHFVSLVVLQTSNDIQRSIVTLESGAGACF